MTQGPNSTNAGADAPWLTLSQVANILLVSKRTVMELIGRNKLAASKNGKRRIVSPESVVRFIRHYRLLPGWLDVEVWIAASLAETWRPINQTKVCKLLKMSRYQLHLELQSGMRLPHIQTQGGHTHFAAQLVQVFVREQS